MIIAQAQDLEQRFGGNTIFSNISFSVPGRGTSRG